ncbi:MAG: Fic family protein, partial [Candidatus Binatia bacterium]
MKGSQREQGMWRVFDKRYWPGDDFAAHLTFALRHEDVDLLILKRAFDCVPVKVLEELVAAAPTGIPSRRIWFFYEWLTGKTLDVPDAKNVAATDILDPKTYFTAKARLSRRHRVRDNLLGTDRFCPIIRRTKTLTGFADLALAEKARETVGRTGSHLVTRAASFLLMADSRASFEIEGERPPRNRLERWGRAVMQAGRTKLTLDEIIRLHTILI